jgi:hypothetical protein
MLLFLAKDLRDPRMNHLMSSASDRDDVVLDLLGLDWFLTLQ